jgi:hypothetical protein
MKKPIPISKKQKPAQSLDAKVEELVGLPEAAINKVASFKPGVMQADIDNLEAKLSASYDTRLSKYLEEIATLQVQLASEKVISSQREPFSLPR